MYIFNEETISFFVVDVSKLLKKELTLNFDQKCTKLTLFFNQKNWNNFNETHYEERPPFCFSVPV